MDNNFQLASREWINSICIPRNSEEKLGESIEIIEKLDIISLKKSTAKYVILGAAEDIGPRANLGRAGADSAFLPAMKKLLNMQSNEYLKGSELLLLGQFNFEDLMQESEGLDSKQPKDLKKLRQLTEIIDERIHPIVQMLVEAGKVPILIGGGHNNSYPLLKGLATAQKILNPEKPMGVNCINLDPHADFRELEGRHSGNGFSYAHEKEYLKKYSIIGMHESYNSQIMLDKLNKAGFYHASFEDIFIRKKWGFKQAIQTAIQKVKENAFGLELDLDSIENIASSAETPCGVNSRAARFYIGFAAQYKNCSYLHIAEGAPSLKPGSEDNVGKLIAYLICDFVKSNRE